MSATYRVATYEAHNICGLKDVSFDLTGRHLFIVGGKNAQGKTSALDALRMALCGKQGCEYPEVPLRVGEREGWVKVALDGDLEDAGLVAELRFTRGRGGDVKEEFRLTDSEGKPVPSPRTLLQRLFNLRAFDPLDFERMDKRQKRETLLKLVGVDLKSYQQQHAKLYAERTAVGKEGKKLVGKLNAMPRHTGVPEEEVSVADLVAEKDRRSGVNRHNEKERERCEALAADRAMKTKAVGDLEEQLLAIQAKLEDAKLKLNAADAVLTAQMATVKVLEDQDVDAVHQQILSAQVTNQKVRDNEAWKAVDAEVEHNRDEWERLTVEMDSLARKQEAELKAANWPVTGLSFDDDGVLYDGLPIEQASKSQRIMVSARIGMALNPRLRLLVSEGGGDMDVDTLEALDRLMEEEQFQMVLELVSRGAEDDERCAVVIENGRVKE
jgi:hypothetical protein